MNAPLRNEAALTDAVAAVIDAGRAAAAKGWVPATSGNFSVRASRDVIAITRSGVDKGALQAHDIFAQRLDEPLLPGSSAEAALHVRLYRDDPTIGAIFHVHSPAATVLGRAHAEAGAILIEGWELQKALRGVASHEEVVETLVFANNQDVPELAERVSARLREPARPNARRAPGYLLAGHGLYAWGGDAADAWRHLEALETLFQQISHYRSYRP
ncbi:MAG: methylthioribulose 1-phosphate dehydratase [Hyphomicrobiales bacterium]|nr:methylthioribulose 1-phosphate dehydratase [Hyphomicrobiales bacterium]MBV8661686.1 methylthioribulose 1-phosphate dehydratase [Hyphomicrobiales bacterium]